MYPQELQSATPHWADRAPGIGVITARRVFAALGVAIFVYSGLDLVSVRAVQTDSLLQILANGLGYIALGLAGLTASYGLSGPRAGGAYAPCPVCIEVIDRRARKCPRCHTQLGTL
jgi:hypothetical protein